MERVLDAQFLDAFPVRQYRWPNGLQALLIHHPVSAVVAYLTHYTVGSAAENDEERGLAHFFEHMMFRETAHLKDGDFDRIMAEAGGTGLNAYTTYDTTAYHVNVPTAQLEQVMRLEADRMVNLRLSAELLEKERGAVLGEMHMYKDMPSEQHWDALMATAFRRHSYRHPVIGYLEQVAAFERDAFARFYQRHYAPNRAWVVVAGGFDEAQVLHLLERHYGNLPPGEAQPPAAEPDPPWSDAQRQEITHDKISTDYLTVAVRSPGLAHRDAAALSLLSALLSAGHASPLYRRIVTGGLGTHASATLLDTAFMLRSPGLFLFDVSLQHGVPAERAEEALDEVLHGLRDNGVAEAELERALNQVRLGFYATLRTNMSLARQIGGYAATCGDPLYAQKLFRAVERVSAEELLGVLDRYVLSAPRVTVVQRPAAGGAS